jgi:ribokinase
VAEKTPVDIAVVGSINADTTYLVPHLPAPGETILGTGRLDAPGGKGANQAAAIAALGASVDFVGAVGDDGNAVVLVDALAARGVGVEHVMTLKGVATGSAVILVAESGENSIVVHPGANGDLTPDHVADYLGKRAPEVIMAQLEIPLDAVVEACQQAHGTVIVNPAPMPAPSPQLDDIIARADIVVPNRTELAALAGQPVPETHDAVVACARMLNLTGQLVVTLGSDGALCFPDGVTGDVISVASPVVSAVDTSGAGDAFCGALAVAIRQGKSLVEAVEYATKFASWSVSQPGAQVPATTPDSLLVSG